MTNTVNDNEYLARDLVDVNFTITDELIDIKCPGTHFASVRKCKPIQLTDILEMYSRAITHTKQRGIKVIRNRKLDKQLIGMWDEYRDNCAEMLRLWECLSKQARLVEQRGIHMGYSDDAEYKLLDNIYSQIHKFSYRSTAFSRVNEIAHEIRCLLVDTRFGTGDTLHL